MIHSDDQQIFKFLKRAVILSGGVTVSISISGLLGWILGLKVLASININYIPISITTCIAFIIYTSILILNIHIPSHASRLILVVLTVMLTILLTLMSFLSFNVSWTPIIDMPPFLISPLTSMLFLLVGIALLLLLRYRTNKLTANLISGLATIIIMVSLIIIISYVYATPLLYTLPIIPMALTTSIAFMCLGVGLIVAAGPSGFLLSSLTGSSVRAMLLRAFVPLSFIGVVVSDIFQRQFTKLNSAIVSGGSLVFFGVVTAIIAIQAARRIGGIVESANAKRKQVEDALRRDKTYWKDTFNTIPDLLSIMNCQHRIVRVNQAMADRLGLTPEQCVGARCHEIVHGAQEPPVFCPHALTCQDGHEHVSEVHEPRLGGDFMVSTTPMFDEQEQIIGTVHVARDITERKQMERAREKLILELQEALAQVKLLSGLLPICASCKQIRDDNGYWQQIEAYIRDHSEAEFSHSICPDCAKKLYPEFLDK